MGASFQTLKMPGALTKAEVQVCFDEAQAEDRYHNGHSYSGGIGMADGLSFMERTFASVDAATVWLDEFADKFGPALAVVALDDRERLWNDMPNPEFGKPIWVIGANCSS